MYARPGGGEGRGVGEGGGLSMLGGRGQCGTLACTLLVNPSVRQAGSRLSGSQPASQPASQTDREKERKTTQCPRIAARSSLAGNSGTCGKRAIHSPPPHAMTFTQGALAPHPHLPHTPLSQTHGWCYEYGVTSQSPTTPIRRVSKP